MCSERRKFSYVDWRTDKSGKKSLGLEPRCTLRQDHMSRQTISHWETGRAPVPTEYISILEGILGCTFEIQSEQEQLIDDQAEQRESDFSHN